MAHPPNVLSEAECWTRLASGEFGRIAYHLADEVHIAPVNYAIDEHQIVFRTSEGSKLLGMMLNQDVAFETDHVDDSAETAWSVIVRGRARILKGPEAVDADNLRLRPWVSSDKRIVVAINATEISGREFHLARPWQHMLPQ